MGVTPPAPRLLQTEFVCHCRPGACLQHGVAHVLQGHVAVAVQVQGGQRRLGLVGRQEGLDVLLRYVVPAPPPPSELPRGVT